jgi:peptidyl-prolyl cis-trans isomerase C
MKPLGVFAIFLYSVSWAQNAPATSFPDLPDNAVIAVFDDGAKMTMGEFKQIYAILPPQNQQAAAHDRKNFLKQWALARKLARMAEEEKLDQQSPAKEALTYYRMTVLMQAKMNQAMNSITVDSADVQNAYNANKERYKQVKLKVIYIAFSEAPASQVDSNGKKMLSEEEARAKAEKLLAQIRGGADFAKLAVENSDDETSRVKNGDFGALRPADKIPDAIRSAVFALKQGETSEPLRQPNGFYLLRAEEVSFQPLAEVRNQIYSDLQLQRMNKWMGDANDAAKVEFPTPEFLADAPAAGGPAVPATSH